MLLMRSVTAILMASASIGSGVWLHGYTQTRATGPGTLTKLITSSPLGAVLGSGKHSKSALNAILRAKHGRLARLRAALGLGPVHPTWANPAALVVIIGGAGSSVLVLLRGFLMRRRARRFAQGTIPPDLARVFAQFGKGTDAP